MSEEAPKKSKKRKPYKKPQMRKEGCMKDLAQRVSGSTFLN